MRYRLSQVYNSRGGILLNYKVVLVLLSIIILSTCNREEISRGTEINELKDEIRVLNRKIDEDKIILNELSERLEVLSQRKINLEDMIINHETESKVLVKTIHLAEEFIEAYKTNNATQIQVLVSDKFQVTKGYICYDYGGEEIKLSLNDRNLEHRLNSYGYENEKMFYQFRVYEYPSRGVSNGYFVNVMFKMIEGEWLIDDISFDI